MCDNKNAKISKNHKTQNIDASKFNCNVKDISIEELEEKLKIYGLRKMVKMQYVLDREYSMLEEHTKAGKISTKECEAYHYYFQIIICS